MEFGDVVYAVATGSLLTVLIDCAFASVSPSFLDLSELGIVSGIVGSLIAGLIVGLIFAGKIAKDRIKSIARIVILGIVVLSFWTLAINGAYTDYTAYQESSVGHVGAYTTAWEWMSQMSYFLMARVLLGVAISAPLWFIGLYVGSMLSKPKTS